MVTSRLDAGAFTAAEIQTMARTVDLPVEKVRRLTELAVFIAGLPRSRRLAVEPEARAIELLRDLVQHWDAGDIDHDYDAITSSVDAARDYVRATIGLSGDHRHPLAVEPDGLPLDEYLLGLAITYADDRINAEGKGASLWVHYIATEYARLASLGAPSEDET